MKRSLVIGICIGTLFTLGRLVWETQQAGLFLESEPDLAAALLLMFMRPAVCFSLLGLIDMCSVLVYPFLNTASSPAERAMERQS